MKHLKFIALFLCVFAIVLTATACGNEKPEVLNVETSEDYWRNLSELSLQEKEIANTILAEDKVSTTTLNNMRAVAEHQTQLYNLAEQNNFFNDQIIEWVLDGDPRHVAYVKVEMSPRYEGEEERLLSYLGTPLSWMSYYYPESRVLKLGTGAFSAVFLENAEGPQISDTIEIHEASVFDTEKTYVLSESNEAFLLFYGLETGYTLFHFEETDSAQRNVVFEHFNQFFSSPIDDFSTSLLPALLIGLIVLICTMGIGLLVWHNYRNQKTSKVFFSLAMIFVVSSFVFYLAFICIFLALL